MITTFYSYKGGVGRTQLVVNLASYLCYLKKKKILLIDWDLEAPGIHTVLKLHPQQIKKGLIEFFSKYVKTVREGRRIRISELPEIKDYIIEVVNFMNVGKIDLIAAGNYLDEYSDKVNDFDWFDFHQLLGGKGYLEFLKKELRKLGYDYIFIDSRTGVTDYAGICNIQMPDINVIVMAPSEQNFSGAFNVIESIRKSQYVGDGRRLPIILPILSRFDITDEERAEPWVKKFFEMFSFLLEEKLFKEEEESIKEIIKNVDIGSYYQNTRLFYNQKMAFGEPILFNDKSQYKKMHGLFESQYANIAEYLGNISIYLSKIQGSLGIEERNKEIDRRIEEAKLRNLAELVIEGYNMQVFPHGICELTNLRTLSLKDNCIESIPMDIAKLENLENLNLSNNNIKNFPVEILGLKNLQILCLEHNHVEKIPGEIGLLANLQEIKMKGNPLKNPPIEIVESGITSIRSYFDSKTDLDNYEKKMRQLIQMGAVLDGKKYLLTLIHKEPFRKDQLKSEFGFLYDFDKPENDEIDWKRKENQIGWWRKIWSIMSSPNSFQIDNLNIPKDQEEKEQILVKDDALLDEKSIRIEKKDDVKSRTAEAKGEDLEHAVFMLFRQFFKIIDWGEDVELIKEKQQDRGLQFGHDLKFVFCETKSNKKIKILIEVKNFTRRIGVDDISGKLVAAEAYFHDTSIDHWIFISPNAYINNELEKLLEFWEEKKSYPFKVQVWTEETRIKEFFGLIPDIYNTFIERRDLNPHPMYWSEDKKQEVLEFWKRKLEPPFRFPTGWEQYLLIPSKLMLGMNEIEFERRYAADDYIDMNCLDEAGVRLTQTLEEKVYQWLEEPVDKSPALFLLGDFGDGKTFFTYVLSRKLAKKFIQSPKEGWLPVRFALKELGAWEFKSVQNFLQHRLQEFGANLAGWNELRSSGYKILAILDGFDEISKELDPQTIQRNLSMLLDFYNSDSFAGVKLFITSRKYFFENYYEKEWLLNKLDNPQLLRLAPIERQTTEVYLRDYAIKIGEEKKFNKLIGCHDPIGLATKPLFLDMVQVSLKDLSGNDLNEYIIYETYIHNALVRKANYLYDKKRMTRKDEIIKNLMQVLEFVAKQLHQDNQEFVYLSDVRMRADLKQWLWDLSESNEFVTQDESARVATRSLLKRVNVEKQLEGKKWPVDFCHRSIKEYFVARAVCSLIENNLKEAEIFLSLCFLSHEILFFTVEIMKHRTFNYEAPLLAFLEMTRGVDVIDRMKLGYLGGNTVNLIYRYKGNLPDFDWRNLVLDGASLPNADLSGKDFTGTSFQCANLDNVNFTCSNFSGCNFTGVRIEAAQPIQSIAISPGQQILALYSDGVIREWGHPRSRTAVSSTIAGVFEGKGLKLFAQPGNALTILSDRYLFFFERNDKKIEQKAAIEINVNYKLLKADGEYLLLHDYNGKQNRIILVDLDREAVAASISGESVVLCDHLGCCVLVVYDQKGKLTLINVKQTKQGNLDISVGENITCLSVYDCQEHKDIYLLGLGMKNGAVQVWKIDVNQWKCEKLLEHLLHTQEEPVKDIAFIDGGRLVTGGFDKIIKILAFNPDGTVSDNTQEYKMTLQCKGMKVDGMMGQVEQKKFLDLIAKTEQNLV